MAEYGGNLLKGEVLKRVGFKGGGSILNPSCNNAKLLEYINDVFKIASQTVTFTLPSYYMVVDLGSGAYCKTNIGHEVLSCPEIALQRKKELNKKRVKLW